MRMPPSSRFAPWSESDEDDRVVVGVLEELPDQPVDVAVVVEDRVLVRVPRLVLAVLGIHELPEAVVHAVGPHLDHREERPRLRLEEVLGEREAPVGHLVDLPQEVLLVVVRKSFVSKRYSPTTSAISSFSAAGYVYFESERRREEAARP